MSKYRMRVTQIHEVEVELHADGLGPDVADALRRAQNDEGFCRADIETIEVIRG